MVLQNKYKARASRRYNSARGGTSDGRGHGGGRGRGAPRRLDGSSFPSLPGHEHGELDKGDDEDRSTESEDSEARRQMSKYAPRKLASNAWRFEKEEEPEADADCQEVESEPDVDLSGLLERVAKLDSSRTSKALSSEQVARSALDADAADVDTTLLYLLDRQRQREKAANEEADVAQGLPRHGLTSEQRLELEREGRRLQEEKVRQEKHERRARILQGAGSNTISLDIGNGRRQKRQDEHDGAAKGKARQKYGREADPDALVHLYLDEEDGKDQMLPANDIDAFLNEVDGPARQPVTSARPNRLTTKSTVTPAFNPNVNQKGNEEDFLDSIL